MSICTDPTRGHATDPGQVDGNSLFMDHGAFNSKADQLEELKKHYRVGRVRDVGVKRKLADALNDLLEPIWERRHYYEQHRQLVKDALMEGTCHARAKAAATMTEVRKSMRISRYVE